MMTPFERAVRGELEGSRGGRAHVQPGDDGGDRATPLSGTQLHTVSPRAAAGSFPSSGLGLARPRRASHAHVEHGLSARRCGHGLLGMLPGVGSRPSSTARM